MCVRVLSGVRLFVALWTVAQQTGSSGPCYFPGKNTGMGYHFLLQGNLLNPGIKLASPTLAGGFFTTELPGKLRIP